MPNVKERRALSSRSRWDGNGESLTCPVCDSHRHSVKDTRHHQGTIRRRRHCLTCGFRFWTAERLCDLDCAPIGPDFSPE